MSSEGELLTIGQLAHRAGVSVRTLRFWSDEGLLPVRQRSASGYRLYDGEALARVDLVVTLRELGFGHEAMTRVLRSRATVAEIAAAHLELIDRQIRSLERQRSVLRVIARRGANLKETQIMHSLAKLTAAERQAILDELVAQAFDGLDPKVSTAGVARMMRELPPDLPDEPTAPQLDAWIELADLASDPSFVARVREMAVESTQKQPAPDFDPALHGRVMEHVRRAMAEGIAPSSPEASPIVAQVLAGELSPTDRIRLRERLQRYTAPRVERYWELMGILNDRPPFPSMVVPYQWLIDALEARE